jgi:hypothetical protein
MLSSAPVPGDVSSRGANREICSLSGGLITVGMVVSRLGVVVVDGVEAKDFGLSAGASAVNSAGVAGMGEPRRLPRCSGIEAVVIGGARSTGGWALTWGSVQSSVLTRQYGSLR